MAFNTTAIITQAEYDALWEEARERNEVGWQETAFERRRPIPKRLGKGEEWVIELQPGLTIHIETYKYWRPLCLDYHCANEGVLLSNFYLAGNRRMINPGIQIEDDREETAGETCLCYISEARSIEYFPAEQPLKRLGIAIDFDRLRCFGLPEDNASPLLQRLIQGKAIENFHQSLDRIHPVMQQALRQILHCPYQGAVRRMYLESKVLELLAPQFDHLMDLSPRNRAVPALRPADIERLHLARDILQQQFNHPPSLLGLARQVGLNDYKLKQGFRQLFGTTVFGYVQRCRIEQSRQLLSECELSVAEVAERVGYASPSRFCHAFKQQVGLSPSEYRRRFGA
ncbi:AraC family transcriptional regulator [Leptolyngbya sp. 7M]|uniref:helix-turn-helix transcriptional regulator n=1 Tax=Leptolyngbya sp. 7M TaxID=2812896 RepID=UPI0028F45810